MKDPVSRSFPRTRRTSLTASLLVTAVVLAVTAVACGDDGPSSPTSPTPTPATTRIIALSGNLAFGEVAVGSSRDATLTISNTGNAVLTVTSLTAPGDLADLLTASWTDGQIAAGASQVVTIRFTPTRPGSYTGTLTVNGDQTSGTNTIAVSATATGGAFSGLWLGGHVITSCEGTGSMQDLACSTSRGIYPPGSRLDFGVELQHNGANASGVVDLGGLLGAVNGTVTGGVLTLRGTATGDDFTATITAWSTTVSGDSMSGTVDYSLTRTGIPGVAGIRSRLDGVTRETTSARASTLKPIRLRGAR